MVSYGPNAQVVVWTLAVLVTLFSILAVIAGWRNLLVYALLVMGIATMVLGLAGLFVSACICALFVAYRRVSR